MNGNNEVVGKKIKQYCRNQQASIYDIQAHDTCKDKTAQFFRFPTAETIQFSVICDSVIKNVITTVLL